MEPQQTRSRKPVKTLLCLDSSPFSRAAFKWTMDTSDQKDTIFLYHGETTGFLSKPQPAHEVHTEESEKFLDFYMAECSRMERKCIPIHNSIYGGKSEISKDICKEAQNKEVDQIIVGSHGFSSFDKFVLGSVSQDCLNRSNCTITVVKDPNVPSQTNDDLGQFLASTL